MDLTKADGSDLTALIRQPKRMALLAYLMIAGRGAFVRRDKLLALFWPDVEAERARSSLRTNLHRLRVMLGADAIVTRGQDDVRASDALIRCDANVLRDASDRADHDAVFLRYTGELLDGLYVLGAAPEFEQWLDRERSELRQLAIRSGWEIVARHERNGSPADAADVARRVITLDRTDEVGMRRLLELLVSGGDRAGAAAAYEEFRRGLASDLDIEPAPETRAIAEALRVKTTSTPGGAQRVVQPRVPAPLAMGSSPRETAEAATPAERGNTRGGSRLRGRWLTAAILVIAIATIATVAPLGSRRRAPAAEVAASRWQVLETDGATPFPRWHPVVVLDSTASNLLLFGGREWWSNLADLWRGTVDSNSVRWTRIRARDPEAGPGGRWLASAVYNPRTDRMILFGGSIGYTSPCTDELWILDHVSGRGGPPTWTAVPRTGPWPAPRADHRMAYDAATNRLMLLGGHDCIAPTFDDYWILKNADGTTGTPTWERVAPDTAKGAPRGVRGFAFGYNAASNRAVLFGGYDHFKRRFFQDTWVLSHANGVGHPAWERLKVTSEMPPGRINSVFGYDPAMNRLVVAQGDSSGVINDAWVLVGADGTTPESRWERLAVTAPMPDPRYGLAAAFDVVGGRLFAFPGGDKRDTPANWVLLGPMGR